MPCPTLHDAAFIAWMTSQINCITGELYPQRTPEHYVEDIRTVEQEFGICMEPVSLANSLQIIRLLTPEGLLTTQRKKRLGNYKTAVRTYHEFRTGKQMPGARRRVVC